MKEKKVIITINNHSKDSNLSVVEENEGSLSVNVRKFKGWAKMKEKEGMELLKKLIESGDIRPAPDRIDHTAPHYEVIIPIGEFRAKILLSEGAYFELMEEDY